MAWDQVQQYVRIIVYGASGFMAGRGWISEGESELIGGVVLAVCTLAWTVYWNKHRAV